MCGIAGFWDIKNSTDLETMQGTVTRMRDTLYSRGPDGFGNWVDVTSGVALGHRRLSIIDLSQHGAQPMESSRYVISFNGEIYNYLTLRDELDIKQLRGHSDTEVILHAFAKWGVEKALAKFIGMFAIALWDKHAHQLYLMRDRIGEKPLYYGWLQDNFVFGSEINSLKQHPAWQQDIDPNGVDLLMQYNCIPAPNTIYKDVMKLQPGHFIVVNKDKTIQDHIYWKLQPLKNRINCSPQEAVNQLQDKVRESVSMQMEADVPVGAFLSGGIDSSTVVAVMQELSNKPVKTFTIGFASEAYNEAEHSKAIALHLGTEHTELYLNAQETLDVIPQIPSYYNEPFSDSSQVPTYIVSRLTRERVTVSLSGDGGDELFGGYTRYLLLPKIWSRVGVFPRGLRKLVARLLLIVPPSLWDKVLFKVTRAGDKLHKLAGILDAATPQEMYQNLISHWNCKQVRTLDLDLPLVEIMMYLDTMCYLPDDILVKVDRAAMSVGLETRVPFLDHRIVEYAWSLPLDYKIKGNKTKWVLRQLLKRYVPESLFEREKMGFSIPLDEWLRGPLKSWSADLLGDSMLSKHGLLDCNRVRQRWDEHQSGARNWDQHLWDVLMFQAWYEVNHG